MTPAVRCKQVEDDEEQEHQAGGGHGAGRKRGLAVLADRIGDRASATIAQGQLNREYDVERPRGSATQSVPSREGSACRGETPHSH